MVLICALNYEQEAVSGRGYSMIVSGSLMTYEELGVTINKIFALDLTTPLSTTDRSVHQIDPKSGVTIKPESTSGPMACGKLDENALDNCICLQVFGFLTVNAEQVIGDQL
jgi:hypothetical protein